jgi:tRNA 2-thiouridine synthesizing protein A
LTVKRLDITDIKYPNQILEIASKLAELKDGDILEVIGDDVTFEEDIRLFCRRINKPLLFIEKNKNGNLRCQIQQV